MCRVNHVVPMQKILIRFYNTSSKNYKVLPTSQPLFYRLCINSIFFTLLELILDSSVWSILESVPCEHLKKNVYVAIIEWSVL